MRQWPFPARHQALPFLLHGGAGRRTMSGFADLLAERTHARVLTPTHPGFRMAVHLDADSVDDDRAAHAGAAQQELLDAVLAC